MLPSSATGSPACISDTLAAAFPEGSEARRAAVAAVGHQLHVRMLRSNVVPSSAMLAASVLPAHVFTQEGKHSDMVSSFLLCTAFLQYQWRVLSACILSREHVFVPTLTWTVPFLLESFLKSQIKSTLRFTILVCSYMLWN